MKYAIPYFARDNIILCASSAVCSPYACALDLSIKYVVQVKASRVLEVHNILLYTVSLETMQIYTHGERHGPIAARSARFVNNSS